jgi:hypothetical protein
MNMMNLDMENEQKHFSVSFPIILDIQKQMLERYLFWSIPLGKPWLQHVILRHEM